MLDQHYTTLPEVAGLSLETLKTDSGFLGVIPRGRTSQVGTPPPVGGPFTEEETLGTGLKKGRRGVGSERNLDIVLFLLL